MNGQRYNNLDLDIYNPKDNIRTKVPKAELDKAMRHWKRHIHYMAKQYSQFCPDLYDDMRSAGMIALWNALQRGWEHGLVKRAIWKAMSSLCKKEYRQIQKVEKVERNGYGYVLALKTEMLAQSNLESMLCRLDMPTYRKWAKTLPPKQREYTEKVLFHGESFKKGMVTHKHLVVPKFRKWANAGSCPLSSRGRAIPTKSCPL